MTTIKEAPRDLISVGQSQTGEMPHTPEQDRLSLVKTVMISGPSWAGKGLLVAELQRRNGWKTYNGKDEFMRRIGATESSSLRSKLSKQKSFDADQLIKVMGLTAEETMLYETRLAGHILAEARDIIDQQIKARRRRRQTSEMREPTRIPAVSLNLWAEAEVRYERAYQAELEEYLNQQLRMENGEGLREGEAIILKEPSRGAVADSVRERQEKDVLDWSRLKQHRDYIKVGKNPFSRTSVRPNGLLVFDWWIDTSNLNPAQVTNRFEEEGPGYGAVIKRPLILPGSTEFNSIR
jgi:hypothetical protein